MSSQSTLTLSEETERVFMRRSAPPYLSLLPKHTRTRTRTRTLSLSLTVVASLSSLLPDSRRPTCADVDIMVVRMIVVSMRMTESLVSGLSGKSGREI